ncbi:MAG: glycosyltransferase [Crocinitomicaceae bacterium]|nr:glycosyltransferase [Crocinitomicaceae bacterium]
MAENDVHILILSSWYPTEKKPFLGNFVQRHAQLLALKYNVTVIHTVADSSLNKLTVKETSQGKLKTLIITHPRGKNILQRKKQQMIALDFGMHDLEKVDLIIGHILLPKGLQFITAKRNFGCPLIYMEHGSYFRPEKRAKWTKVERFILNRLKRNIDAIVTVSDVLRTDVQKSFPKFNIHVIGNHIDTTIFKPSQKENGEITKFLHVSTLDENTKNPRGIFTACEALKKITTAFKLTIICDEDVTKWQTFVNEKELTEHVEFIGPLQWEELVPYYQNSDAFVLFSEYESFSIVLAEAWATGTPVISTSVGIANNMPNTLGIQVQKNDPESLCNAMLDIMEKESTFQQETIRNHAMQYDSKEILKKWVTLIDEYVR